MTSTLERELSAENLNSYAKACVDIGTYMEILYEEGYSRLLIPSRGAYPFFLGSMASSRAFDGNNFYHDVTWLPFTADISSYEQHSQEFAKDLRRYWTKLYSSLLNNKDDIFSRFYKYMLKFSGHTNSDILTLDQKERDNGVIIIDTVISGRASATILDAFDEFGIKNYHALLVVDANLEKLREPFKSRLEEACNEKKATLIPVSRIFTEDRGPAMSGISSIVYPNLMKIAAESIGPFSDFKLAGAGIWHDVPREHSLGRPFVETDPYLDPFESFNDILILIQYSVGRVRLNRDLSCLFTMRELEKGIDLSKNRLINNVSSDKILNTNTTLKYLESETSRYKNYNPKIGITSSHIVTVNFSEEICRKIIHDFKKENKILFH